SARLAKVVSSNYKGKGSYLICVRSKMPPSLLRRARLLRLRSSQTKNIVRHVCTTFSYFYFFLSAYVELEDHPKLTTAERLDSTAAAARRLATSTRRTTSSHLREHRSKTTTESSASSFLADDDDDNIPVQIMAARRKDEAEPDPEPDSDRPKQQQNFEFTVAPRERNSKVK
ncbi:unnamed protein product, partial [Amoebophrya sp. A120]